MNKKQKIKHKIYDVVIYGSGLTAKLTCLYVTSIGLSVIWISDNKTSKINDTRTTMLSPKSIEFINEQDLLLGIFSDLPPTKNIFVSSGENKNFVKLSNDDNQSPLAWLIENKILNKSLDSKLGVLNKNKRLSIVHDSLLDVNFGDAYAKLSLTKGKNILASLVIAADGSSSSLRGMAKIKTFTMETEKQGMIGTIRHNSSHPYTSWQKFSNKSIIALLAMKNDKKYGFHSLHVHCIVSL